MLENNITTSKYYYINSELTYKHRITYIINTTWNIEMAQNQQFLPLNQ